MSTARHEIYEKDIGAYLLGALSDAEERRFEEHLDECHICRDEVESLRVAVDALPRSAAPVVPPESLKRSLMEAVRADVEERSAREGRSAARSSPSLLGRIGRSLSGRGRGFGALRPAAASVGVLLVLLVGVLAGYAGARALSDPDRADTISAAVDKRRMPAGSGSLLVREDRSRGAILRVHGMPTLDDGSVYQVWVERDGDVIPQSLFSVGSNGAGAAAVEEDLEDADAVMVTREEAGGARAPSEEPVLTVRL